MTLDAGVHEYPPQHATAAAEEIARFDRIASAWWDPNGAFRALHRLNPVRIDYIREAVCRHIGCDAAAERPFDGLTVIDVGCGGGLVAEAVTRLGGIVTGIDASEESVRIAQHHALIEGLPVSYRLAAPEQLAAEGARFHVVLALEIVEHVADPDHFFGACEALLEPGGALIVSTINRTLKSLLLAKIGAEYVLRWLPAGTHDWRKFVKPSELFKLLSRHDLSLVDLHGLTYDPVRDTWSLGRDLDVNYIGLAV
jgi:2-polyprenyl-6-hydroxyphenyl methylase/3-demethylubiquinone-9 3-methyltransferase